MINLFKSPSSQKGMVAENLAILFLKNQGLKLITQNYRCRYGEIDLIMQEGDTTVFVEVRLRHSMNFGGAKSSITLLKQAKLKRTAEHYLQKKPDMMCRFDIIAMHSIHADAVEWIKDAF